MKLEINKKKKWKIHKYMELKQHISEEPISQRYQKGYFKTWDKNWNTIYQHLSSRTKAIITWKFIVIKKRNKDLK